MLIIIYYINKIKSINYYSLYKLVNNTSSKYEYLGKYSSLCDGIHNLQLYLIPLLSLFDVRTDFYISFFLTISSRLFLLLLQPFSIPQSSRKKKKKIQNSVSQNSFDGNSMERRRVVQ